MRRRVDDIFNIELVPTTSSEPTHEELPHMNGGHSSYEWRDDDNGMNFRGRRNVRTKHYNLFRI